ncbi:GL15022 [Drosophila persimilis]|uniref:GL15022 n=1 Tax=Drosophila persimilis TaxID=7234 RepID=B4H0N8_DROPE|nr:GL15022 [Drosophila persimilis]
MRPSPTTGFAFEGNSMAPHSLLRLRPVRLLCSVMPIAPAFGASNGGGGGGGGGGFGGASNAAAAKPSFNFGGSSALSQSAATSGPFNFGGSGTAGSAIPTKPAFNFTGSATVSAGTATPQATPAFNFSAGSATANSLASGDLQSTASWQRRPEFTDGAPQDPRPRAPFAATVEVASQASETTSTEAAAAAALAIALGGGTECNSHMNEEDAQAQPQRMGLALEDGDARKIGQTPREEDEDEEELVTDNESSDRTLGASSVGGHRRSRRHNDSNQQQIPHVSKYRFVRSVTGTVSASTAGTATEPDEESTTTMFNTAAAKLTRQKRLGVLHSRWQTRSKVTTSAIMSNRSHRGSGTKRISHRQRYNDNDGTETGVGSVAGVGARAPPCLRSRYKLVRREHMKQ